MNGPPNHQHTSKSRSLQPGWLLLRNKTEDNQSSQKLSQHPATEIYSLENCQLITLQIQKEMAGSDKLLKLTLVKQGCFWFRNRWKRILSIANPEEVGLSEIKSLWLQLCVSDSPTQSWTEKITGDHSLAWPIHKGKNFPSQRDLIIELQKLAKGERLWQWVH